MHVVARCNNREFYFAARGSLKSVDEPAAVGSPEFLKHHHLAARVGKYQESVTMDNDKIVPAGEILVYQTEDGKTRVECRFEQETVWLSQALIGELFQVSVPTVNEHLKNIFEKAELAPEATIRKFRIVRWEGQREVSRKKGT